MRSLHFPNRLNKYEAAWALHFGIEAWTQKDFDKTIRNLL